MLTLNWSAVWQLDFGLLPGWRTAAASGPSVIWDVQRITGKNDVKALLLDFPMMSSQGVRPRGRVLRLVSV